MAWHMGIHAYAHTLSFGTIHFSRRQNLWANNGLLPNYGVFACVCRHGNMYAAHMLTESEIQGLWAKTPNSYFLHASTAWEDVRHKAMGERLLGSLPVLVKWV